MPIQLREGWYSRDIEAKFDVRLSGIYEWRIAGVGLYVGKALNLSKRINAYPNNVLRKLNGKHWHGNPMKKYRLIHDELLSAHEKRLSVSVVVLENCDPSVRAERELWWIRRRQEEALAGGPRVLN